MAECSGSQLTVNWFGLETEVVNMSDWTNGRDSNQNESSSLVVRDRSSEPEFDLGSDYQKRSDIVHAIIHNHSLDHLGGILGSGWDVNETLRIPEQLTVVDHTHLRHRQRTALGEAVRRGWTEGVRMLLDAGAKCMTSDELENPITLALRHHREDCKLDLIELLLQHGADPNDGQFTASPLKLAIGNCRCNQNVRIVQLLLEHGADPNVRSGSSPLQVALLQRERLCQIIKFETQKSLHQVFAAIFRCLVNFGADVNYTEPGRFPILHDMMFHSLSGFLQEQLDMFFLHGGNINIEVLADKTVLEHDVRACKHINNIRWLIRHGADTSPMQVTLLKENIIHTNHDDTILGTPLLLLQAGMRVSHGAVTHLNNMEMAISAHLQENSTNIYKVLEAMWDQLQEAEEGNLQRMQCNLKKSTFPEYWTRQMADLQEFSDENLDVYPEVMSTKNTRERWQNRFDQIHTMLEFLSQAQSLHWYCRRCVRENLVSLQPSVVKTLPIPARLKRYILCHEI